MKALVKREAAPGLVLADVPEPVVGPGDVLVKVRRTGICGTDLHIAAWDGWAQANVATPLVVGHEFCGDIVAGGAGQGPRPTRRRLAPVRAGRATPPDQPP